MPSVIQVASTMCRTASILGSPIIVTEQYPQVFKATVPELQPLISGDAAGARVFSKKRFGMMTPEVEAYIAEKGIAYETAILFGIEAHACVLQTCLDLLERGKGVCVVADGVSSQRTGDRDIALQQMAAAGAAITTTESIMLALCESADHPKFKTVSKLLIEHNHAQAKLERLV